MEELVLEAAAVARRLDAAGLGEDADKTEALTQFLNLLNRWNRVYNLTSVRGRGALIERHLVESLALKPLLAGTRLADLGSGAGLPGIPLAICEPARRFTLIEGRAKRARFLRHVVATLALGNVTVAHSRAEDLPRAPPFDTVLARAVARPARLLEIVRPLTAPGSIVLLLTSGELARELKAPTADFAIRRAAAGGAARLQSAIVVLERTACA